jgi:translation initiation factor 2B subunit (eIF-2B alpha/beta/delta family)
MQDPWETVVTLAADRELGANDTASQAARALGRIARADLADAIETLIRGHPSMAPLWRLGSVLLSQPDHAMAAERFANELGDQGTAAAVVASSLPSTLLTISCSATVAEAIRIRKPQALVCMASEPGGEGMRMAGLAGAYTRTTVIPDREALEEVPGEAVLVGADAVTPRSVLNKAGTRDLAEAASARGVPVFAVAGSSKLVPVDIPAADPYQATPIQLFTRIATPGGLEEPVLAAARAAAIRLHPALVMLAEMLVAETGEQVPADAPLGESAPER